MQELPLALKVEDVARELDMASGTAYELVHSEAFPTVRIGRCIRVPREAFPRWTKEQATTA
jgi:excisionase family DNA binding protein